MIFNEHIFDHSSTHTVFASGMRYRRNTRHGIVKDSVFEGGRRTKGRPEARVPTCFSRMLDHFTIPTRTQLSQCKALERIRSGLPVLISCCSPAFQRRIPVKLPNPARGSESEFAIAIREPETLAKFRLYEVKV